MNLLKISLTLILSILLFSCKNEIKKQSPQSMLVSVPLMESKFNDYWYRGEAELNSYTLEQARYGEIHKGEAVLVFVTEVLPWSPYNPRVFLT